MSRPSAEQRRLLDEFRRHEDSSVNRFDIPEPIFREAIRWIQTGELCREYGPLSIIAYSLRSLLDMPREHQPWLTGQGLYERVCAGETRWHELGDDGRLAWARAERVLSDGLLAVVMQS